MRLPFRLILLLPFRMRNWLATLLSVQHPMPAQRRNRGQPVQVILRKVAQQRPEKALHGPALKAELEPAQAVATPQAQVQEIVPMQVQAPDQVRLAEMELLPALAAEAVLRRAQVEKQALAVGPDLVPHAVPDRAVALPAPAAAMALAPESRFPAACPAATAPP